MNATETTYFKALRDKCLRLAASLNDPQISGVRTVISNLYRDDAHFIYELLQNADDQGATYAKFMLHDNELLFVHNAPKHFTISNPDTHKQDYEAGCLGDINSILSIASSSKSERTDEIPIGKFGLGFKSVFVYTDCPEIYDDNFRFRITDFIVPELIDCDDNQRKPGETLFRFRFKTGAEQKSYAEVDNKLRTLVNPLLFLRNLKVVDWEDVDTEGSYRLDDLGDFGSARRLKYLVACDDERTEVELWKFSRKLDESKNLEASVVFVIEDGRLSLKTHPLYCYLPTANDTQLPVILHAPFRLTGNRESITASDAHNIDMIDLLAKLLVDSLTEICCLGQREGNAWIDDNIIAFIPDDGNNNAVSTAASINLRAIRSLLVNAIKSGRLLWCEQLGEYLTVEEGVIAENMRLPVIYDSKLLPDILGKKQGWVLQSLISDLKKEKGTVLVKELGVAQVSPEKLLRNITKDFLAKQPIEWLRAWYDYLPDLKKLWDKEKIRQKEIILTSDGEFRAAHVPDQQTSNVLFAPSFVSPDDLPGLWFVHPDLANEKELKSFFSLMEIDEVDDFTMAEKVYLNKVNSEVLPVADRIEALMQLIDKVDHSLTADQGETLRKRAKVPAWCKGELSFIDIDKVKVHNADNDLFFMDNTEQAFFEPDSLKDLIADDQIAAIEKFVRKHASTASPTIKFEKLIVYRDEEKRLPEGVQRPRWDARGNLDFEFISEPVIEGLTHFISHGAPRYPLESLALLEKLLAPQYQKAKYNCSWYGAWRNDVEIWPLYREELVNAPWIEFASERLRAMLGLPPKELQQSELDTISQTLANSGILSKDDVDSFLAYIRERGVLDDFELKKQIEEQQKLVQSIPERSLKWLDELLNLRLKYVESKEDKGDIEFLVRELKNALNGIVGDRDTDLRDLLPDDIRIIFGPPGTGKTTRITQIISDLLKEDPDCHIAVLAPTNAAANVVADRLNKCGVTAYRAINAKDEVRVAEVDALHLEIYDAINDGDVPRIVSATTHYYARSSVSCKGHALHDERWDAVFIDETSMVTLDYVLLALLKSSQINPDCKFYIVGDPLQLPAITNLDPEILEQAQLDEFNFYSFIGLKDFSQDPPGVPDKFKKHIELLHEQYRSVSELCNIMSQFAYDGKVTSKFKGTQLTLPAPAPSIFKRPLNFVRFPVDKPAKDSSGMTITELGKLKGSNFNIYSALLVKEALQSLFDSLKNDKSFEEISVGIITAYTAQKKLIEKLLDVSLAPRDARIKLYVNTVHQFQGDEFDVVMLVLNPPNVTMQPAENILINKFYLINVATSRAKNNLVIVYPDESCAVENYWYINRRSKKTNIEKVAERVLGSPVNSITISAGDLEQELFGRPDYLFSESEVIPHEEVTLHHPSPKKYRFTPSYDSITIVTK